MACNSIAIPNFMKTSRVLKLKMGRGHTQIPTDADKTAWWSRRSTFSLRKESRLKQCKHKEKFNGIPRMCRFLGTINLLIAKYRKCEDYIVALLLFDCCVREFTFW
jgi:hypothetical protein